MTTARPTAATFTIEPRGPFSLAEAATFGFGQREAASAYDGVMRLAFCVDGYRSQAAADVRQDRQGVHVAVQGVGDVDIAVLQAQVARVLSLDHDGEAFTEIGRRDPVIGRLQAVAPGLRPPPRACGPRCSIRRTKRRPGVCCRPGGPPHGPRH